MALYKIDNKVTTEQGLNTKKPNSLNVIKKGSFYFKGRENPIVLDSTNIAYTIVIRIHHGLNKLFLTPGVTAICDRFDKTTDTLTGNENITNIKPWIAGGLYASTGTVFFRRAQILSSDYLSLTYTILCTSGTATISSGGPKGWVQWQILNSDDNGKIGVYGGGDVTPTGKYYFLDLYDFDEFGNLLKDPLSGNPNGYMQATYEYANAASYTIEPNLYAGDLG